MFRPACPVLTGWAGPGAVFLIEFAGHSCACIVFSPRLEGLGYGRSGVLGAQRISRNVKRNLNLGEMKIVALRVG
jgi:hypothetical protein